MPGIELPARSVSLADLSAFRPTSANWKVAGGVTADRRRPLAMTAQTGAGILVNIPTTNAKGDVFTTWAR